MKIISNKSKIGIVVLALLTSLGVSLSSPTIANASTDCQTAQSEATSRALSLGDVATATAARRMCVSFFDHSNYGLLLQDCDAIDNFYVRYSAYLKSTYYAGMIRDAYESCLTNNAKRVRDFLARSQPVKVKFKSLKAPKMIGIAKVGQTLKVQSGTWSGTAKATRTDWYVCKNPNTKPKSSIFDAAKYNKNFVPYPANNCGTQPIQKGSSFKLLSKYKGKFLVLCQLSSDAHYWGYYCTSSTKVS
jgi:hypothetical protein